MTSEFRVDLSQCSTLSQLAVALGVDADVLTQLAAENAEQYYRRHSIPKRSAHRQAGSREVYEAGTEELRQVHKTLNRRLLNYVQQKDLTYPLPCCYGFVRGRATRDNAQLHCGQPLLFRADIEDFFPSISIARVQALLTELGVKPVCADVLSRVLCFKGFLVPGLSASPLVSNLVARGLDARLIELAGKHNACYTRYADDIAFSGVSVPSKEAVALALEAEAFSLAPHKCRLTKRGQAHFVTGLSINDPKRPHVPKRMKRRLRQELYYSEKFGTANHLLRISDKIGHGVNRLDGMVRYVSFVERGTKFDLTQRWGRLLARDDLHPDVPSNRRVYSKPVFVVVDETYITTEAGCFLALGFAEYTDHAAIEEPLKLILGDYLAHPFVPGKKSEIKKNGLHFADAHESLREKVVNRLPELPFRMLVGVTRVASTDSQACNEAYMRSLAWGVGALLQRANGRQLTLMVEKSQVARTQVIEAVQKLYALKEKMGIARPISVPAVDFVDKTFVPIALADFMLGVLNRFVRAEQMGFLQFEQVRDRFTLIHDIDNHRYYSRSNPFNRDRLLGGEPLLSRSMEGRGQSEPDDGPLLAGSEP